MQFYSFHVGDYTKDTAHLTPTEDLIYRRLIDFYYAEEQPLENDAAKLARRIRMQPADFVQAILSEFFALEDDGCWHHARIDREIEKYQAMRTGGKEGSDKRWKKGKYSEGNSPPKDRGILTINHLSETINHKDHDGAARDFKSNDFSDGYDFDIEHFLTDDGRMNAVHQANGWDVQALFRIFNEGVASGKLERPRAPQAAFLAWIRKYTKGRAA